MSEDIEQHVDTNSVEWKQGLEAGVNPGKDVKASTPLFLRDSPEGDKGNAQDEKDETEE